MADWRGAFWVGIVPVVLALISFFTLPESEKWKDGRQNQSKKENLNEQLFAHANRKNLLVGSIVFGAMLSSVYGPYFRGRLHGFKVLLPLKIHSNCEAVQ